LEGKGKSSANDCKWQNNFQVQLNFKLTKHY